ncbi:MAG: substrate-binding domain-containing protein [Christensenella sp.]|nr:substrate-binding domain-containing protein [Christensenella sp.]
MSISKFKFLILAIAIIIGSIVVTSLSMMQGKTVSPENIMRIGLIETDTEDSWRQEMIEQVKLSAEKENIRIIEIETERTQSAQINAIRSFIVYGVDAIVFSPVTNNGWDYVLEEAAKSNIAVVTVNDVINSEVEGPFATVTYDYRSLGESATNALLKRAEENGLAGEDLKILELKGAIGSTVSENISEGIRSALENSNGYKIGYSANADYMRSRAKELVNGWLIWNEYDMNVIIAHNDAMALGAIDALEKNGLLPGRDIQIVTFGGGEEVKELAAKGKISYLAQCDLNGLGDKVVEIAIGLENNKQVPEITYLNSYVSGS